MRADITLAQTAACRTLPYRGSCLKNSRCRCPFIITKLYCMYRKLITKRGTAPADKSSVTCCRYTSWYSLTPFQDTELPAISTCNRVASSRAGYWSYSYLWLHFAANNPIATFFNARHSMTPTFAHTPSAQIAVALVAPTATGATGDSASGAFVTAPVSRKRSSYASDQSRS